MAYRHQSEYLAGSLGPTLRYILGISGVKAWGERLKKRKVVDFFQTGIKTGCVMNIESKIFCQLNESD